MTRIDFYFEARNKLQVACACRPRRRNRSCGYSFTPTMKRRHRGSTRCSGTWQATGFYALHEPQRARRKNAVLITYDPETRRTTRCC